MTVPADLAGFAEVVARRWLTAGADSVGTLDPLFLAPPRMQGVQAGARRVVATAAVAARLVDVGYWAVTVVADIEELDGDAIVASGTWHVEVGVLTSDTGPMAATAPAVVAAPAGVSAARPAGPALGNPDGADPVTGTAEAFLSALLAGAGDIARYLAPDVTIVAVDPPPFAFVTVERAAVDELADGRARARLEVRAATAAGNETMLGYEVVLAARADRWEVLALSGAPALTLPASGAPPEMTPRQSPSTTATSPVSSSIPPTSAPGPRPGA